MAEYDETNNGKLIPKFRERRIAKAREQIYQWKQEGYTKEEIYDMVDRRVVLNSDIDSYFPNDKKENNINDEQYNNDIEELNNGQVINEISENEQEEQTQEEVDENTNVYQLKEEKQTQEEQNTNESDTESIEIMEEEQIDEDVEIINEEKQEDYIHQLKDEELEDFPDQPFKMYNEEQKEDMIQSIKINGIIQPIVVRPLENGKYQILSGHNRRLCGRKAGLKTFPCKIKYGLSDDEAKVYLVDTNLATRTKISPIERARALLIKKNAYKSKTLKNKIEKTIIDDNIDSVDIREKIKEIESMSGGNLQRYLRLNYLNEDLQNLVDEGKMNLKVAENISFLDKNEQRILFDLIEKEGIKISESQAKKLKNEESLNKSKIMELIEKKETKKDKIVITLDELKDLYDVENTENLDELKEQILNDLKLIKTQNA